MPCLLSYSLLSSSLLSHILVLPSSLGASFCDLLSSFVCFFLLPLPTSGFFPLAFFFHILFAIFLALAACFLLSPTSSLPPSPSTSPSPSPSPSPSRSRSRSRSRSLHLLSSSRSCFQSCLLLRLAFFLRLLILLAILLAFHFLSASFSCLLRLLACNLLALAACLLLPQAYSCVTHPLKPQPSGSFWRQT